MAKTDWMGRGVEGRQLWGERAGGQELPAQKLAPEFFGLVLQFCFGMFWSRPNPIRDRSLCTVAQLAALGQLDELNAHLHGALNLGIRREELTRAGSRAAPAAAPRIRRRSRR